MGEEREIGGVRKLNDDIIPLSNDLISLEFIFKQMIKSNLLFKKKNNQLLILHSMFYKKILQ